MTWRNTVVSRTILATLVLVACGRPVSDSRTVSGSPATQAAAAVDATSSTPLGADSGVLLDVIDGTSQTGFTLWPIAILVRDSLIDPPQFAEENAADPFVRRFLARDTRYPVFVDGAATGEVRISGARWTGCSSYEAHTAPTTATVPRTSVLAGRLPPRARVARRRALLPGERATLDSLLLVVLQQHGISATTPRTEQFTVGFAFTVGDSDARVVALVGNSSFTLPPADSQHAIGVSLIAEQAGTGWSIRWQEFEESRTSEYQASGSQPIDVLDIDGDGVEEVVFATFGVESRSYLILRRRPGTWVQWYRGGGDGC